MDDHLCAAAGCTIHVPYDDLMCLAHWRRVPLRERLAVIAAWNAGRPRPHYEIKRNAAIAAVIASETRADRG